MSRYRLLWRNVMSCAKLYKRHLVPVVRPSLVVPCTLGFSLVTLITGEKKLSAEDELIQTIKHCVLFVERTEYEKAEQLLHVALRQAQQINHQLGITYIYDVMANLALEREQLDKAKQLFIVVTQRIMADGAEENDPRVVHISLKLARISHLKKEYTTAQLGYDWCLEKLNDSKFRTAADSTMLLALAEDWYGRLLIESDKCEQGLKLMTSAMERMKTMPDFEPGHIVLQLNDIGTVCDRVGMFDESIHYFTQAIDLGKKLPNTYYLGTMYVNLGRAYMKKNLLVEARKSCGYGWKLAVTAKNKDVRQEAEACLSELKKLT